MIRFGDYSFDVTTGELTRGETTRRLAPQASQLLSLLIAHAGDVVTREELQRRIWPDTTVEFDQGLNFCIRQLRIALDDDASRPTYIETLPRRGYRLIVPVEGKTEATRRRQFGRELAAASLLVVGVLAWAVHRETSTTLPVLAIVPFNVDTTAPELGRYRDALAESMVERTTRDISTRVAVLGPSMTKHFGARTPIDSMRVRIGAAYALSGVVRRSPNGVDVFAQFIRASDRAHLWALRVVDSASADGASALGSRIADSVVAILLHPERPRTPRGFETNR